jgi:PAS domain S-box-containing protein
VYTFISRHFDAALSAQWPAPARYGFAVACVAGALLLTLLVPGVYVAVPFLFFFPAVFLSAIVAGFVPSLLAVALATFAVVAWVFPASGVQQLSLWPVVLLARFVFVAIVIVSLVNAWRVARARLYAESEALRVALAATAASEERFRVAQELSLDAFAILDAVRDDSGQIVDFYIQYANPKAAQIVNTTAPLAGRRLLEVLPGSKSHSELFDRYVKIAESGQPHDIELSYDADGIQAWFRNMTVKLGDGVAISFADITARKQYERQVTYAAFLLENVSDAVFAFDQDLHITLWNQGAEALYGWKAEEVIGHPAGEIVRPAVTPDEARARVALVEAGQQRHFEVVHHNRTGDLLHIDSTATAIRGDDGAVVGYVAVNRDATARKRYERELQQLNASLEQRVRERTAELERSNRELDQFAYVASHDLKAPLRAISLLAQWITEDAGPVLPPQSQEHLARLNGRVKRLESLLDDLLDYSRAGRIRQAPETVDTERLVKDVVDLVNPPPGFRVLLPAPLPVLFTERVPLETVFRNLIDNACKHHHQPRQGSVTITATEVAAEPDADGCALVAFSFADDGPGIAPEYHERVFRLFQTLKPRDLVEGSGMGLSIVKKTVETRGGTVHLDSNPGAGATLTFTWPASPGLWVPPGSARKCAIGTVRE